MREEGDEFREKHLHSKDEKDKTPYTPDWRKQVPGDGDALGGPYIGVHMRRGDFAHYAHKETVPSIEEIGTEVQKLLDKWKIKKVYLSTDGTDEGTVSFRLNVLLFSIRSCLYYFKTFAIDHFNDISRKLKN